MTERPVDRTLDLDELFAGCVDVVGREALVEKIRAGKRLIVKHGVDPTARDLHLGYAVCYQAMRRFQDAGHTVVLLIGDYTSGIGDPTGKDKTRPQLSPETIEANIASMLSQVDKVLDASTLVIRRNSEWLGSMDLADFLRLGTRLSAARLWERDMFQRRLADGAAVYLHEFLYPVLQGYDSYALQSDITINGTDQLFNELMGREIQGIFGQSPQAIMTMPLLPGTDGVEKMSQSLGNAIGLAAPAEDQYGKVLSIPDALMESYFRLATRLPLKDTNTLVEQLRDGTLGPMDAKMRLAREIVTQYHSAEAAQLAEERFIQVHREHAVPEDVPEHTLPASELPLWIGEVMKRTGLVGSTSEAIRQINAGGVQLDGERLASKDFRFTAPGTYLVQKGKRHFARIHIA